jgi:hypothetical protein
MFFSERAPLHLGDRRRPLNHIDGETVDPRG